MLYFYLKYKYHLFFILMSCTFVWLVIYFSRPYISHRLQIQERTTTAAKYEALVLSTVIPVFDTKEFQWLFDMDATADWFPSGIKGNNVTGYPDFIVPNIVHYVLIDVTEITFVHYISIMSALINQMPDRIIIHCNCDTLRGKYWNKLTSDKNINIDKIKLRKIDKPLTIYGMPYSKKDHIFHLSDILRNRVLMEFGGIYLDRDVYVVKSLNYFRKFELTLGIDSDCNCMGTQVQIAHKRARFLRLYLQTYQKYDSKEWYWNAGQFPTIKIIEKYPHLIHLVRNELGVSSLVNCVKLYKQNDHNWQNEFYTIHLLMRDNSIEHTISWCFNHISPNRVLYDENVIQLENTTFGQMARLVFYNTTNFVKN